MKKFLKNVVKILILILLILLCCHLYTNNFLLMPLKSDILSNTEQNSILRSELHDIEVYLDQTAIQLYALEEQINAQAKNIQGLTTQKKEHESKNKLQNDKEIIEGKEELGLGGVSDGIHTDSFKGY